MEGSFLRYGYKRPGSEDPQHGLPGLRGPEPLRSRRKREGKEKKTCTVQPPGRGSRITSPTSNIQGLSGSLGMPGLARPERSDQANASLSCICTYLQNLASTLLTGFPSLSSI